MTMLDALERAHEDAIEANARRIAEPQLRPGDELVMHPVLAADVTGGEVAGSFSLVPLRMTVHVMADVPRDTAYAFQPLPLPDHWGLR